MLSNPKDKEVLTSLEPASLLRRRTDRADDIAAANQTLKDTMRDVRRLEAEIASGEEHLRAKLAHVEQLAADLTSERVKSATLQNECESLRSQRDDLSMRTAMEYERAHKREAALEEQRVLAQRRAGELELELDEILKDLQLERGRVAWFTKLAERQSARAAQAEAKAEQLGGALGDAIRALLAERENSARLQLEVDEALNEWFAASTMQSEARAELAEWIAECEHAITHADAAAKELATVAEERDNTRALLDERSRELLRWLDELEAVNLELQNLKGHYETLESDLTNTRNSFSAETTALSSQLEVQTDATISWRGRSEALEGDLANARESLATKTAMLEAEVKEQADAMIYWRGRCEALEVHLATARGALSTQTAELERQLQAERDAKVLVSQQLADLTERFSKFAEIEIARTRSEVMHVSAAIDRVQGGRVWNLKRVVGRLLGRGYASRSSRARP